MISSIPPFTLSSAAANSAAVAFTNLKWPHNPFHEGEIALQQAEGVQESVMSYAPQFVRPYMPDPHRAFYTSDALPFLVAAARDGTGAMWATLLEQGDTSRSATGSSSGGSSSSEPLVESPNATTLHIHARPVAGDALASAFHEDTETDVGLLGIMMESARRNRVNGRAVATDGGDSLVFTVDQSFGNCPQYIKPRSTWVRAKVSTAADAAKNNNNQRSTKLSAAQARWIATAETIFTASGYRGRGDDVRFGNDASHRGGPPGFVEVSGDGTEIAWTEFKGNNHFNTLGNILLDARVGLAIPNFASGGLLQVTGTAAVEMGRLENGARRVRLLVTAVNELPAGSLPIRWPSEDDAADTLEVQVAAIVQESANVKSFYFKPAGAATKALPTYRAGQHLPIELSVQNGEFIQRSYSLSSAAADSAAGGYYRISVKREPNGKSSSFLHDHMRIGDRLTVGKPVGAFTREKTGTTVLLSSGIGITPVLSMLHEIAAEKDPNSKVVWIHGARNGQHHPFQAEVDTVWKALSGTSMTRHVVYSRPEAADVGPDFVAGHITADFVQSVVPHWDEASFYMCGPLAFLADLETGLQALGVDSKNIHFETF